MYISVQKPFSKIVFDIFTRISHILFVSLQAYQSAIPKIIKVFYEFVRMLLILQ